MQFLKQSTAVTLMLGPFLDDTDGKTYETGLTLASGNIRLSKNGGAFATTASAISLTHNECGWYSGTFNTTDTNTAGRLLVTVSGAGALPVWREFMVLPSMIYDSFVGGTASLTVYPTGVFTSTVTVSGLTSAALGQIVTSGTAAGWNDDIVTVSGLTSGALGQIVISGNAAGWNTTNANVTGIAPLALSQIVASGDAAGWDGYNPVTVSGLTAGALSQIVSSGNADGWADGATAAEVWAYGTKALTAAVTTSGLTPEALTQIVASGNAAGWDATSTITEVTVTGLTSAALTQIVASGNADGWADGATAAEVWGYSTKALTTPVTTSGLTKEALTQIVDSGNAAGWADGATAAEVWGYTPKSLTDAVTTSGLTSDALSQIVSSGNAANWSGVTPVTDLTTVNTKLDVISGYTDTLESSMVTVLANQSTINGNVLALPDISEIISSGNAEGWNADNYSVTVTGIAPAALSEIVASGDAAGWNSTATLTGIAPDVWAYANRSLTDTGTVVTGIFNEILAGTLDFRTAQLEQWAYAANNVNISGTVSGVAHEYFDPTDSGLFRLEATPSGRIRTDL